MHSAVRMGRSSALHHAKKEPVWRFQPQEPLSEGLAEPCRAWLRGLSIV